MRRVAAIALWLVAGAARADEPAPNSLVVDDCRACHDEQLLAQQRLTPKQWAATVKKMQGWGAPIEPEKVGELVDQLARAFSTESGPYAPKLVDARAAAAAIAPLPDGALKNGDARRGDGLYQAACAACHGPGGDGSPKGVNLVDRPLLQRAPELAAIVRKGRGRMPAFPQLSDRDLAAILAWLRTR